MTLKVDGTNGVLQAYDYQVTTSGSNYQFLSGTQTLVMNPAATLATFEIRMPATAPADGTVLTFSTTQQITALTVTLTSPQTMTSAPTFMAAGSSASYVYNLANTAWRPLNNVPQLLNVPIGVGQTWQNVLSSRAVGTTYTNTTGRPIFVSVGGSGSAINTRVFITLDGSLGFEGNGAAGSGFRTENCIVVPAGSTYVITAGTGTLTLLSWNELR